MGFFDDILIPPESLQQPAKLYPALKYFHDINEVFFSNLTEKALLDESLRSSLE